MINLKWYLFIAFLVIVTCSIAQKSDPYCIKQSRVSVGQIDYDRYENNMLVSSIMLSFSGDTIGYSTFNKNEKDFILDRFRIYKNDTTLSLRVVYDLNSQPIYSVRYQGVFIDTTWLALNQYGDRIRYNSGNVVNYTYDSLNRKTKEWAADYPDYVHFFFYDKNNRLIKENGFFQDSILQFTAILTYDSNGNLVERAVFEKDNTPAGIDYYEYDTESFLVREWGYIEYPFIPENKWEILYEIIDCK